MQYQIFNTLSGALLKKDISKNSKSVDFTHCKKWQQFFIKTPSLLLKTKIEKMPYFGNEKEDQKMFNGFNLLGPKAITSELFTLMG